VARPKDYKVDITVFDDAISKWGRFTVDAFASPATYLVSRYWTAKEETGAEHTDAFSDKSRWKRHERIWAHPPLDQLSKLVELLDHPERLSEVVVCAPAHSSQQWFFHLTRLADETTRYTPGKLVKVADDAPARVGDWPIVLFHLPARKAPRGESRGLLAGAELARGALGQQTPSEGGTPGGRRSPPKGRRPHTAGTGVADEGSLISSPDDSPAARRASASPTCVPSSEARPAANSSPIPRRATCMPLPGGAAGQLSSSSPSLHSERAPTARVT